MAAQAPTARNSFGNLTISRKPGQTIVIGDGLLVLEVQQCRGDRTSIRISAPRELRVDRGEVHAARVRMGGMINEALRAADDATNQKADQ